MKPTTKPRGERLRANVAGPAELRRLAAWYDVIALDYRHAVTLEAGRLGPDAPDEVKLRVYMRGERDAQDQAGELRRRAGAR